MRFRASQSLSRAQEQFSEAATAQPEHASSLVGRDAVEPQRTYFDEIYRMTELNVETQFALGAARLRLHLNESVFNPCSSVAKNS